MGCRAVGVTQHTSDALPSVAGTGRTMKITQRLGLMFRAAANKIPDRAEEPAEMSDYSCDRQIEILTKIARGLAGVMTNRKRIELQMRHIQQSANRLFLQAEQAIVGDQEDLAREALTRRSAAWAQVPDLRAERDALSGEENNLTAAVERLQTKWEVYRIRKQSIPAGLTAVEAQTKVNEAVGGISDELGAVALAMQRAEDKTAQMQHRAAATDELIASGMLDDATVPVTGHDDIQVALDTGRAQTDVLREITALNANRVTRH
jgi:phage shock protein A